MKRILRLLIAATLFAASCSKQPDSPAPQNQGQTPTPQASTSGGVFTKVIYTQTDAYKALQGLGSNVIMFQAQSYAQIRASELPAFTQRYRNFLFGPLGVPISEVSYRTGWTPRFNCVFFSEAYVLLAGAELNGVSFHSWVAADRPAVFVTFYTPDNGPVDDKGNRIHHSIVLLLTDEGPKFIEPQMSWTATGEVKLSPAELASVYYKRG